MNSNIKMNECIEDETKTSPFAVYPGERLSVHQVPMPRSLVITDVDQAILLVVNKYLILTSRLILKSLQQAGMVGLNQKDLQHRLHMLTEAAYLQSARFTNEDGTYAANKIYSVGYRGRGYIKNLGMQPKRNGYVAQLDPTSVKRYLSVNQYLINTGKDYRSTEVGLAVFVPEPKKEKPDNIFRAYGLVQEENKTVIVESVRRDGDRVQFLERLNRMAATLCHKRCNLQIHKTVELVLIAESKQHLQEVNAWLKDKRYDKIDIRLTTDLLVYSQPESCLAEREKASGFFRSLLAAIY